MSAGRRRSFAASTRTSSSASSPPTLITRDRRLALSFNNQGVPPWEDRAIRSGWPLAAGFVSRALGIRSGVEVEDEAAVWREFDFVAELLDDGRRHPVASASGRRLDVRGDVRGGDRAACLRWCGCQPERLPPATAALVQRAREHPAGRYALSLFTEYRRAPVA
jgi:hypothetical protein